jgi:hypothetical protein
LREQVKSAWTEVRQSQYTRNIIDGFRKSNEVVANQHFPIARFQTSYFSGSPLLEKIWPLLEKWNTQGAAALTSDENALIKRLGQLDVQNIRDPDWTKLLTAGEESRKWAVDRLLKPKPNDNLQNVLSIIRDSEPKIRESFESHGSWSRFKERLRPLVKQNPELRYPWNLSQPKDLDLLAELAKNEPRAQREIVRAADEISHQLTAKYPKLDEQRLASNGNWLRVPEETLPADPLSEKLKTLRDAYRTRDRIGDLLDKLVQENPATYVKYFSEDRGEIRFHSFVYFENPERTKSPFYRDLLQKFESGAATKLTSVELAIARRMLAEALRPPGWGAKDVLSSMLTGTPEVRKLALEAVTNGSQESARGVMEVLEERESSTPSNWNKKKMQAKATLLQKLEQKPEFRAKVRSYVVNTGSDNSMRAFPWNLADAGDAEALNRAMKLDDEASRRVLFNVLKNRGYNKSNMYEGGVAIHDPELRRRYETLQNRQHSARVAREYVDWRRAQILESIHSKFCPP